MDFERPVRSPQQIHISRIYFIGRQIESLPNGLAPHRPFRRASLADGGVHVQERKWN